MNRVPMNNQITLIERIFADFIRLRIIAAPMKRLIICNG